MTRDDILLEAEMSMEKSVDYMVHEFSAVRTGKASPALVENVDVEAYGSAMKLKQLALITTPEPRLLVVQPFDAATSAAHLRRYRADAATGTMRCSYGVPGHMTNGCPGLVGSRGYPWSIPRVFKIISAGPVWTPGVPSTGAA